MDGRFYINVRDMMDVDDLQELLPKPSIRIIGIETPIEWWCLE